MRYFVRHPTTQLMPRKVKTAFTATDEDVAITGIHDIGFIPRERDGVRGVEIRVGGGTSIMPRVAPTLYDFVELDNGDYLKVSEAVFRIFDRQEWLRVNRARARIKVLIDKIGIDAFREMVEEELEGDWVAERDFSIDHLVYGIDEEANAPAAPAATASPNGDRSEFDRFREANVRAAAPGGLLHGRGEGHPRRPDPGAVPRPRRRSCASTPAARRARPCSRTSSCAGCATRPSTTSGSGCVELGLGDAGADEITDVVSCPGTDSCKLGITSSMGLNRAVQERVEAMQITDPLTKRVHIKMSGCPNGCSQHHIANIGFYGASLKVGGRTMPAYIPHLGGNYEGGEVVYGHRLKARLPAKRVPDAVERWLRLYEAERDDGEAFNDFVERVGTDRFEAEVKELTLPAEFSLETMNAVHRLEPLRALQGRARRGRVRGMSGTSPRPVPSAQRQRQRHAGPLPTIAGELSTRPRSRPRSRR